MIDNENININETECLWRKEINRSFLIVIKIF